MPPPRREDAVPNRATPALYHNYRGIHIIDNGLKSSIFVKDEDLCSTPVLSWFEEKHQGAHP